MQDPYRAHGIIEHKRWYRAGQQVSPGFHQVYFMANIFHEHPAPKNPAKKGNRQKIFHARTMRTPRLPKLFILPPLLRPHSKPPPAFDRSGLGGRGPAGLGDDALELVDLLLGADESPELGGLLVWKCRDEGWLGVLGDAYPLLRELPGALVTAVAEELDDTALVGGEAVVVECG